MDSKGRWVWGSLVSRDFGARRLGLVASPANSGCCRHSERRGEARPAAPGDPRDVPSPAGAWGPYLLSEASSVGPEARGPPSGPQAGHLSQVVCSRVCAGAGRGGGSARPNSEPKASRSCL